MIDETTIVRERQKQIRTVMDLRHIAIKAVQMIGGWETPSTVLSYFPADGEKQPATMSVAALYRLLETKALAPDILSLLLPTGFQIIRAPEGINHDTLCELAAAYVAEKNRAHHPESEAGREIGPNEDAALTGKVVQLVGSVAA